MTDEYLMMLIPMSKVRLSTELVPDDIQIRVKSGETWFSYADDWIIKQVELEFDVVGNIR